MAKKKKKDRSASILDSVHALHTIHGRLVDRAISAHQVSNEQYTVLSILAGGPEDGYSLKQIQMLVPNNTSNTTRLVDKLRQKKLLVKSPARTDKRELRIRITPAGLTAFGEMSEKTSELNKQLKKGLKSKNAKVIDGELKSALVKLEKLLDQT